MHNYIQELTSAKDIPLSTYHHCLARMICNPPLPDCYLGECEVCPGTDTLKQNLFSIIDKHMIDTITYKQWIAVDCSSLERVSQHSNDFVESFCEKLEALCSYSFIASQQCKFFNENKSSLKLGEIIVFADFSENFAFVLQDAAQGFHWNIAQATIHPLCVEYVLRCETIPIFRCPSCTAFKY